MSGLRDFLVVSKPSPWWDLRTRGGEVYPETLCVEKRGPVTVACGCWVLCLPKVHFAGPLDSHATCDEEYDLMVQTWTVRRGMCGVFRESRPDPGFHHVELSGGRGGFG